MPLRIREPVRRGEVAFILRCRRVVGVLQLTLGIGLSPFGLTFSGIAADVLQT